MQLIPYNREKSVTYSSEWALKRNPAYLDFSLLGGDCTNFISQCLFAGIGVMNYTATTGWYYIDGNRKAPAWTAARYLHPFLLKNQSLGPYALLSNKASMLPGDIIQLMNSLGEYYHSLLVLRVVENEIYIAAHTNDSYMRPLSSYEYFAASFLKIIGGRQ